MIFYFYSFFFLSAGKDCGYGKNSSPLLWTWGSSSAKWNAFGKFCEDPIGNSVSNLVDGNATHCSTVERLYTWEKKLYQEVKVFDYDLRLNLFLAVIFLICRILFSDSMISYV